MWHWNRNREKPICHLVAQASHGRAAAAGPIWSEKLGDRNEVRRGARGINVVDEVYRETQGHQLGSLDPCATHIK